MDSKSSVGQLDASFLQRVVFVGGLPETANAAAVRAAMIPFGEVKSVDLPVHYDTGKHRGYAFVEFIDPDDTAEAIFNMDGALFLDSTITAGMAQPNQLHKLLSRNQADEAIWKSDEWFQEQVGNDKKEIEKQAAIVRDGETLQET